MPLFPSQLQLDLPGQPDSEVLKFALDDADAHAVRMVLADLIHGGAEAGVVRWHLRRSRWGNRSGIVPSFMHELREALGHNIIYKLPRWVRRGSGARTVDGVYHLADEAGKQAAQNAYDVLGKLQAARSHRMSATVLEAHVSSLVATKPELRKFKSDLLAAFEVSKVPHVPAARRAEFWQCLQTESVPATVEV